MKNSKLKYFLGIFSFFYLSNIFAQSTKILPFSVFAGGSNVGVSSAPASGSAISNGMPGFLLRVHTSCYAVNLRNGSNPISPDSLISGNISLNISGQPINISVQFPGTITSRSGIVTSSTVSAMSPTIYSGPITLGAIFGNTLHLKLNTNTVLSSNADGTPTQTFPRPSLTGASFTQQVMNCGDMTPVYGSIGYSTFTPSYACGTYMAVNGAISASISAFSVSTDNSSGELYVSFPGQTGFCGGYFSPLMVFFDEKRPQFTGVSDFPVNPAEGTSWVEKNAPGYFLVFDSNHSGQISNADQIFGKTETTANGFEKLKALDTNHDGWIDKNDKDFSKLYLWKDNNGDGISSREELIPLSSRVARISLNYNKRNLRPIGKFAEERETSQIVLNKTYALQLKNEHKNKRNITESSQPMISDIWLAPQPHVNSNLVKNN